MTPLEIHLHICHRCKRYSQTQRPGGCAGPCPCHWDGKDIIAHAHAGYCPIGAYPFRGLGSVMGWLMWKLRIPQMLRRLRLFDPAKCNCAKKQASMNDLSKRVASWWRSWFVPTAYAKGAVLELLTGIEMSGRMLRKRLADRGIRRTLASFYGMMEQLEEANQVEGFISPRTVNGVLIEERHYRRKRPKMESQMDRAS